MQQIELCIPGCILEIQCSNAFQNVARSLEGLDLLVGFGRRLFCFPAVCLVPGDLCSGSLSPPSHSLGTGTRHSPEQIFPSPSPPLSLLPPSAPRLTVVRPSCSYLGIYHMIPCGDKPHFLVVKGKELWRWRQGSPGRDAWLDPMAAGDSLSDPSLTRGGAAAAPRGLLSSGACALVCVKYSQLPTMSGSASIWEQT